MQRKQLFHYVPLNMDGWQRMTEHHTTQMQWQAYAAANERFGAVVLAHYALGDMVWAQDYHLMLLPAILKAAHPKMKVRMLCLLLACFFAWAFFHAVFVQHAHNKPCSTTNQTDHQTEPSHNLKNK
jgi:hypothetical protein